MIIMKILINRIRIKIEKIFIVFDDMIAKQIMPYLFIKTRKIKIRRKNIRLKSADYFHKNIRNKCELQQIALICFIKA